MILRGPLANRQGEARPHEKLVEIAARRFRELDGLNLTDLMKPYRERRRRRGRRTLDDVKKIRKCYVDRNRIAQDMIDRLRKS